MTAQPRARRSPRTSSAAAAAVQLAAPPRAPLGLALASAHLEKLKPGELSAKARAAAAAFAAHAQAANTTRSYRTAMEYWQAWHLVRYGMELPLPLEPVPVEAVLQFLVDHALRPKSSGSEKLINELPLELDKALVAEGVKDSLGPMALSTLNHRISVLSSVHRQAEASLRIQRRDAQFVLPNPCEAREVRELLHDIRRSYARRNAAAPRKKAALTGDLVQRVLDGCDDSLIGVRDRALLAFAFASGGRRRSELAAADLAHLRRTPGGFQYHLAHSKTNQAGEEREQDYKPVLGSAGRALQAWLDRLAAAGKPADAGPIFRRVRMGTTICDDALTTSAIYRIVKTRCEAVLDVDALAQFSPHSLRSGFLTEAGRKQVPFADAMAMSGHTDIRTALGYYRAGDLACSPASRLLDESEPATSGPS
jgi:integrase